MTTDDRRSPSFFRRLFTRRVEEAAAAGTAPPASPGADPGPPTATVSPEAADGSTLDPAAAAEAGTLAAAAAPEAAVTGDRLDTATLIPSPRSGAADAVPVTVTVSTGEDASPAAEAATPARPATSPASEAATPTHPATSPASEAATPAGPATSAAGQAADGSALPTDRTMATTGPEAADPVRRESALDRGSLPEDSRFSPTTPESRPSAPSDKPEISVVGGEVSGPLRASADSPGTNAGDGHVPSFLDADFDEADDAARIDAAPAGGTETLEPAPGAAATEPLSADKTAAGLPTADEAGGTATASNDEAGSSHAMEPLADHAPPTAPVNRTMGTTTTEAGGLETAGGDRRDAGVGSRRSSGVPRRPEVGEWRGIVLVTGTDTEVGKTVATAAVAAAAQASGLRVAVIKPGQTGILTGEPTDIEVVSRLAAPETVRTLAEYPEPMAPLAAATIAEMAPLELYEVVDAIRTEADKHDLVLVEGAGGLLVPMGVRPSGEAWTLADLATTLGVGALVVARAGLGTLNHTALTLEALHRRGVPAGVIIGAWPAEPQLVHWANLSELVPHLVGALPEGAGRMDPGVFRRSAPGWLTPALFGVLDNWRVWAEESG